MICRLQIADDARRRITHHASRLTLDASLITHYASPRHPARQACPHHRRRRGAGARRPHPGQRRRRARPRLRAGVVPRRRPAGAAAPARAAHRQSHLADVGQLLPQLARPLRQARAQVPGLCALLRRLPALWRRQGRAPRMEVSRAGSPRRAASQPPSGNYRIRRRGAEMQRFAEAKRQRSRAFLCVFLCASASLRQDCEFSNGL